MAESPFSKAQDAPPSSRPAAPKASAAKGKRVVELIPLPKLHDAIADMYNTIGALSMPVFPATGMATMDSADKIADAWCEYAKTSAAAHRFISGLIGGIGFGSILAAHVGIVMALYSERSIPREDRMEEAMNRLARQQADAANRAA